MNQANIKSGAFTAPVLSTIADKADPVAQIKAIHADLLEAKKALAGQVIGLTYIVVTASDIALSFDVDGSQVKNPKPVSVQNASRFGRVDAEHVAACVIDGNGQPAHAVHIVVALDDSIRAVSKVIALIEQA